MKENGNLGIYSDKKFEKKHKVWDTGTKDKGHGPFEAKLQKDGNFVV